MDSSDRVGADFPQGNNPFSVLVERLQQINPEDKIISSSETEKKILNDGKNFHSLLANVFHFTNETGIQPSCQDEAIHLFKSIYISSFEGFSLENFEDQIGPILFERLTMNKVELAKNIVQVNYSIDNIKDESALIEDRQLYYLYGCFYRLEKVALPTTNLAHLKPIMKNAIIDQTANYLFHPGLYNGTESKFLHLFDDFYEEYSNTDLLAAFLKLVADKIEERINNAEEKITLEEILSYHFYEELLVRMKQVSLDDSNLFKMINLITCLISSPVLGRAFMILNSPWEPRFSFQKPYRFDLDKVLGISKTELDIMSTLLGRILSVSCLPCPNKTRYEFFNGVKLYDHEHMVIAQNITSRLEHLIEIVSTIFLSLLKQTITRDLVMNWIGLVLFAFKERGKLWNNEILLGQNAVQPSDGFMINFGNLLLQLCKPFSSSNNPKLLKIDPRYCKATGLPLTSKSSNEGIFLREADQETFMIPTCNSLDIPTSFNFMTEIFFLTHKALHLGFRSCHERFLKMFSNLQNLARVYHEALSQYTLGMQTDPQALFNQIENEMTPMLSMRTMLSQDKNLELMLRFSIATCTWCINLAMSPSIEEAQKRFHPFVIDCPLTANTSECVAFIPEFVVENILETMIFIRRHSVKTLQVLLDESLEPMMTFVLTFMGNPQKMNNPHLRAKIAEILETMIGKNENLGIGVGGFFGSNNDIDFGKTFFFSHPHIDHLIPTLLHVFVSIEMTGTSVAFEQKFQYRRPMYLVLRYLWREVETPHKRRMKELAVEAEESIENPNPPLFLRFINLLINDAIFLLDEALGYMSKLREIQQQKDSGAWNELTTTQRQEQTRNLARLGRLARFHNIIGNDTINTISWLTEEIKTIFSHKVMVDRIAAMCNYFLLHLVGPKKKNFKVKDVGGDGYFFKPSEIVYDICCIYVNLGSPANPKWREFCCAVVNDARSYSDDLLSLASDVLIRTGKAAGEITFHLENLARKLNKLSFDQAQDDIDISEVPEEFIDPIMGTIMSEPVALPSGYILDRSTIARHLLSDQTDPFTRKPLNMEMVSRVTELEERIVQFKRAHHTEQRKHRLP